MASARSMRVAPLTDSPSAPLVDQPFKLQFRERKRRTEALKPKLDQDAKADDVWSRVEQTEGRKFSLGRDYQAGARTICQDQLGLLLQTLHEQVPESGKVKKDF